jgi:hypothetical protein
MMKGFFLYSIHGVSSIEKKTRRSLNTFEAFLDRKKMRGAYPYLAIQSSNPFKVAK